MSQASKDNTCPPGTVDSDVLDRVRHPLRSPCQSISRAYSCMIRLSHSLVSASLTCVKTLALSSNKTQQPRTLFPGTDGSGGSGSGDALPSGNSKLKLGVLISIACGGTIVLLTIVAVVRGKCKRQAIYLTANEWSDNSRNWQGGFNDDDDDQILLGGL